MVTKVKVTVTLYNPHDGGLAQAVMIEDFPLLLPSSKLQASAEAYVHGQRVAMQQLAKQDEEEDFGSTMAMPLAHA